VILFYHFFRTFKLFFTIFKEFKTKNLIFQKNSFDYSLPNPIKIFLDTLLVFYFLNNNFVENIYLKNGKQVRYLKIFL
jgi:hypothetical protein